MAQVLDDQMAVFADPAWRDDLAVLAESKRVAARRYAADALLLASLAARVPRPAGTHQSAVPWQSFLREVAVARGVQDRAAQLEVQRAELLTTHLPHSFELLASGAVTVAQALALTDELVDHDPQLAAQVDARLRGDLPTWSPQRITREARRAVELLDADVAADRAAKAAAGRAVSVRPRADGQAYASLNGPALPMTRRFLALTETARALRQAGDPRGLDALRYDLVMGGFALEGTTPVTGSVPAPVDDEADLPEALRPAARPPADPPLPFLDGPAPGDVLPEASTEATHSGVAPTVPPPPDAAPPDGTPASLPEAPCDRKVAADEMLLRARAQAERVLEAAHAAEAEALRRTEQVRAEHDRLMALVLQERLARSSTLPADRRASRPVQLLVHVPVTTLLGLADEPGYLEGYGWIGAPQCRQLLPTAELRQVCTDGNGMVVDLAERAVRAGLSPTAAREALLRMATEAFTITEAASTVGKAHDPSPHLADLVRVRDRFCDGPLGTLVPADRTELDHAVAYPAGPTAPWNLTARAKRSHRLKHGGWTPVRTGRTTIWTSPAGQLAEQARHQHPPAPLARDARLPDPEALHEHEARLLQPQDDDPDW